MAKNTPEYEFWSGIDKTNNKEKDDFINFGNQIDGKFITVKEYAWKYGIHPRTVQIWCAEGRIEGAFKFGTSWAIPDNAPKPKDGRLKNGDWVGYRKRERKNRKDLI